MKYFYYIIFATAMLLTSCTVGRQVVDTGNNPNAVNPSEAYIQTYYPMAVEQMNRHGIPASITLAQALLEGGAGRSDLVKNANNHFGVKADKRWQGKTYSKWDNGKLCKFRVYKSTLESYEDHSKFLTSNSRYNFLFDLNKNDYKGWAKGLKKAGYAEDGQYPEKLIAIIERYALYKYDSFKKSDLRKPYSDSNAKKPMVVPGVQNCQSPGLHYLMKAYGLIYTIASEGDSFKGLAKEFDISKRKLRKYNDLYRGYVIKAGDIIYLERKNRKAVRGYKSHTIQPGESLHAVSQKYGIRLKRLYKMNPEYKENRRIKVGDIIKLR